ncbi:MAG: RidA family protein [Bacillota bacterium]|nr:RidA family protein [Bacillota bacterium]
MNRIEAKLQEMGLTLPPAAKPVAAYVPTARTGNLVFTAGQIPMVAGQLKHKGRLGAEVGLEQGYECARICALNCLSAIKAEIGDLDRVVRVVKVTGFVASATGFTDQPKVINGASELLVEVFGQAGKHARSAVGVAELPLGSPTEVEMIVEVSE